MSPVDHHDNSYETLEDVMGLWDDHQIFSLEDLYPHPELTGRGFSRRP